jgi:predicted PurR-regulated permease PerM
VAKASTIPAWQRAQIILAGTAVGVVVIAALYWAQTVFIPVALAVFLTFLLSPLVRRLQRWGLGRTPSVILVVLLAAGFLGGLGYLVTREVTGLIAQLPKYSDNIRAKVKSLREMSQGGVGESLGQLLHEVAGELKGQPAVPEEGTEKPGAEKPAVHPQPAVVVQPESPPWLARLPRYLGSILESTGSVALAVVLVVFMLLKREDLRNRFLRLVGHGQMTSTTKAVDEAGARISRYLLSQLVINSAFGLALALGLLLIGVEYALLWGFLGALLRYVPYVGAWIAASIPITLSLAMFPGWLHPLLVIGLVAVLELIASNVLEPRMFGQSIGVSEVALLTAAAFWAFLWGPIGLVLSGPLTVVLVVLGKYVPQLEFFDVLLGDEPALDPDVSFYQRLLARDQDEAEQLVQEQLKTAPPEQVYDQLLVPALNYAKRDRARDELTEADESFILGAIREIVEDLADRVAAEGADGASADRPVGPVKKVRVLCCPARDEEDQLALEMLRQLLEPGRWEVEVTPAEMLTAEMVQEAAESGPALVCVGSLPPGGLAHSRYLCKRLRSRFPDVKIVVGRWGLKGNAEQNREQLRAAGADEVETTLTETRNRLRAWLPVLEDEPAQTPAGAAVTAREGVSV